MIKQLYFTDIKEALKASFTQDMACYIDRKIKTRCWLSKGVVTHFENT